jgi:hypothetical protein
MAKGPEELANAKVTAAADAKRKRAQRPFPACPLEEALDFAKSIYEYGSGKPVKRLSLFDHLNKSPDSSTSRMLITNSNKYGLTKGSYVSENLELSTQAIIAVDDEAPARERAKVRIELAITAIEPFNKLYEQFQGNKLPARAALIDAIKSFGVDTSLAEEAVDTFIVNLRFTGLLQTLSGADRIVSIDHYVETLPASTFTKSAEGRLSANLQSSSTAVITGEQAHFQTICFYITPIGEDGSEQRKHSDLFLGSIVEPALESLGLTVVRADAIDKPGTITRQIMEYLLRSRLVIADLSFQNPNVFYELAIRHAARLPVVQLIRSGDRLPFDVQQMRTIRIDTSDIYTLVPRIDTYRSEVASQVRRALDDPESVDNPIITFFPSFKVVID